VCLGRPACGERFTRGRLQSALRVRRGERLCYVERGDFAGGDPVLSEAWGLGGAPVFGLFVIADARADDDWIECVRQATGPAEGPRNEGLFSVTRVGGVVLGRYIGRSTLDARARFESMFAALRPRYADSAAITPRIWRT
jgi:urease accessory protein